MTQLFVLGAIVAGFAGLYMYISKNKENFVRKNEPPKSPFDVIYLPADLDAHKNSGESSDENES